MENTKNEQQQKYDFSGLVDLLEKRLSDDNPQEVLADAYKGLTDIVMCIDSDVCAGSISDNLITVTLILDEIKKAVSKRK